MNVEAILPAQPSWWLIQASTTRDWHATNVHAATRTHWRLGTGSPTWRVRIAGRGDEPVAEMIKDLGNLASGERDARFTHPVLDRPESTPDLKGMRCGVSKERLA